MERDLGSFLRVRGEIAQQIAALVQVELAQRERLSIASTRDVQPEAMTLYLKGRATMEHRDENLSQAAEYFEAAVKISPEFAEAYVGLADAEILRSAYAGADAERAYRLAIEATGKALAIDDALGEAWATQAFAHYVLAWDFQKSAEEFVRAVELSPHSAEVHHWFADFLSAIGHHQAALEHSRLAESRSPLSAPYSRDVAWSLFFARRYDEAIWQLETTLERHPDFVPARTLLGRALVQQGRYQDGIAELQAAGDSYSGMLAHAYAVAGRREEAEVLLQRMLAGETSDPVLPYQVALIYAGLGEADSAFEWIERAFRERDPTMVSLKTDPFLDPLRGDERLETLLRRMKFPP
jgi:tetratricopeptide (TPR) repeat protein